MTKEVSLSRDMVALVDDEDYERIAAHRWHVTSRGYAARHSKIGEGRPRVILMHRLLAGIDEQPHSVYTDHVNGNQLDNRKANLRSCTPAQNSANTVSRPGTSSRHKGVSWHRRKAKWVAHIRLEGVLRYLGCFENEDEAGRAYDEAARAHHGEFIRPNFPTSVEVA